MSIRYLAPTFAAFSGNVKCAFEARICRRRALLAGALGFVLLAGRAWAECPQGDPMGMLIEVQQGSAPLQELWDMGVDPFGARGDRLHLRVCGHMAQQLTAMGVVYDLIHEDIYAVWSERHAGRPRAGDGLPTLRDESFVEYHDLAATEAAMQGIAEDHPDLATILVIGQSIEGRDIHALRLSTEPETIDHQRPAMVVVGCHHAREWISVEVPLYLADYLTDNYLIDVKVTRLLNYTELWIIPVLNVDGFAFSWTDLPDNRFWRKNRRDNGDGSMGVDMNRNYSIGWGGEGASGSTWSDTYRGTEAFSEPETRVLRDLMDPTVPNGREFVSLLSYHNYSQVVLYPNGYIMDEVANVDFYEQVAAQMTSLINNSHSDPQFDYEWGQTSHRLYIASGTTTDWVHNALGGTGIIIEVRPRFADFDLPEEQILPTCEENLPAFLHMAETTMIPDHEGMDADLDGFINADDYCPNSPGSVEVDAVGCAESDDQDVDGDGVTNLEDACRDSLPGQQIDADGCRVEPLFAVRVSSNVGSVEINVDPPDIDAAGMGNTGESGFSREYTEETTITLTAPQVSDGSRFLHWDVGGEPQDEGAVGLTITASSDVEALAVYVVPTGAQIVGFARFPDRQENGLASIAQYRVQVVYTDGSTLLAVSAQEWSLSEDSVGLIFSDGRLLAYDVSGGVGEVEATITASTEVSGLYLACPPFTVTIFDAETMSPRCQEIAVAGPERVESNSTTAFTATVLLDGETLPRSRSEEAEWTVSWADPEKNSTLPASISDSGTLSAHWVAQDASLIVRAAYINDDSTVYLAEQAVVIGAGDPDDNSNGGNGSSSGAACGALGMLGFVGMFVGLVALRITRR